MFEKFRRMKRCAILTALAAMVLVAACNKSEPDGPSSDEKPFLLDGVSFATLQEAFDRAVLNDGQDGYPKIRLTSDAFSDGAKVQDGYRLYLELDCDTYDLVLANGASIDANGAGFYVTGQGGSVLSAGGTAPAFISGGDLIYFSGDLTVEASTALQSACEVYFDEFEGVFKGNVKLDDAVVYVLPSKGKLDIPVLETDGLNAAFSVRTDSPQQTVTIGKVCSTLKYPVCSDTQGAVVVGSGATPHVHTFGPATLHPSNCVHEAWEEQTCNVCGEIRSKQQSTFLGPCSKENLVHHAAVTVDDTQNGHMEYWECSRCHRMYTDAEGQNLLEGSPVIFARNREVPDSLLNPLPQWSWTDRLPQEQTKVLDILMIAEIADLTMGIVSDLLDMLGVTQNRESLLLQEINNRLDELDGSLKELYRCTDAIYKDYFKDHYIKELTEHNEAVETLYRQGSSYLHDLVDCYKDSTHIDYAKVFAVADKWKNGPKGSNENLLSLIHTLRDFKTFYDGQPMMATVYKLGTLSRSWEHEFYDWMYKIVEYEALSLAPSIIMAAYWLTYIDDPCDRDYYDLQMDQIKEGFRYIMNTRDALTATCKERSAACRAYVGNYTKGGAVSFAIPMHGPCSFSDWFYISGNRRNYYFPRDNEDNKATESCNKLFLDVSGGKSCVSWDEMQDILQNDKGKKKEWSNASIDDYLMNCVHFTCGEREEWRDKRLYCYNSTAFHRTDTQHPYCMMFRWDCYSTLFAPTDAFYAQTMEGEYIRFLTGTISRYDGEIKKFIRDGTDDWYTLEKISDQGFLSDLYKHLDALDR